MLVKIGVRAETSLAYCTIREPGSTPQERMRNTESSTPSIKEQMPHKDSQISDWFIVVVDRCGRSIPIHKTLQSDFGSYDVRTIHESVSHILQAVGCIAVQWAHLMPTRGRVHCHLASRTFGNSDETSCVDCVAFRRTTFCLRSTNRSYIKKSEIMKRNNTKIPKASAIGVLVLYIFRGEEWESGMRTNTTISLGHANLHRKTPW